MANIITHIENNNLVEFQNEINNILREKIESAIEQKKESPLFDFEKSLLNFTKNLHKYSEYKPKKEKQETSSDPIKKNLPSKFSKLAKKIGNKIPDAILSPLAIPMYLGSKLAKYSLNNEDIQEFLYLLNPEYENLNELEEDIKDICNYINLAEKYQENLRNKIIGLYEISNDTLHSYINKSSTSRIKNLVHASEKINQNQKRISHFPPIITNNDEIEKHKKIADKRHKGIGLAITKLKKV